MGRLGDLGSIDKKYDIAVSTAAAYLDYVVVLKEEHGKAAIEYLRRTGKGRVSLLCIDSCNKNTDQKRRQSFNVPENT